MNGQAGLRFKPDRGLFTQGRGSTPSTFAPARASRYTARTIFLP
jgi:hypothetical protein